MVSNSAGAPRSLRPALPQGSEPPAETARPGAKCHQGSLLFPSGKAKNCDRLEPDAAFASVGSVFDFPKILASSAATGEEQLGDL